MTIAIVPTFVQNPIPTAPTERTTDGASPVDDLREGADFASILLGLPTIIAEPVRVDEAPARGKAVVAAASQPADESQFLATIGLPPLNRPAKSQVSSNEEFVPSRPATVPALITAGTVTTDRQPPMEVRAQPGDDRQAGSFKALATDDTPAKFAVADLPLPATERAAPAAERIAASKPEPVEPANGLSTLTTLLNVVPNGPAVTHEVHTGLQTPLRDPSWAGEFGQKLLWFASNEKQVAQLTVHPPQLGSIEITLNMDKGKDSATAQFFSPNADVRGAIETAVPRLREMFAGAGIQLGQVSIGSESFRQQSDSQQQPAYQHRPPADNAILGIDSASGLPNQPIATRRGQGLIDIFA